MRILAVCLAWLASLLPHHGHHGHAQRVRASQFGPFGSDPRAGKTFACARFHVGPRARALVEAGMIFADRGSKCGTIARVCSEKSGRCADAARWDAGPWGRTHDGFRYGLDLWHVLARRIGHDGHCVSLTTYPEGAPTP